MTRKLTDLGLQALRPRGEYFEEVDGTSGLRLAIFPSGAKSFLTRYRRPVTKDTAKLTHGRYPAMSLAEARVRHAEALRLLAQGTDPGEVKRRAKAAADLAEAERRGDAIEVHVKQHLERQSKTLTENTWKQARLALEGDVLRAWHGRMVGEVRRRDVIALVEKIAERRGPMAGNRAFGHIRRFFNALVERDVIAASPCVGVQKPSVERARERERSTAEIASLWHALDTVGGPACAAIKLLLLTGQRRSEVGQMTWSEIDGKNVWQLPKVRTKNRRQHIVPLSRQALAVIERQPKISEYVFTNGGKAIANFSRVKTDVDRIMKPDAPWVVHDLRRTCASGMQRLGVRAEVIERALNHVSGVYRSVAGIYQRDPLTEEVRDALAAWGREVERIVKGESAKVVKLRS